MKGGQALDQSRHRRTPRGSGDVRTPTPPHPMEMHAHAHPCGARRARTPERMETRAPLAERKRAHAPPEGWRRAHAQPPGSGDARTRTPAERRCTCTPGASCALVSKGKRAHRSWWAGGTPKIRPQQRRTSGVGGRTCLDAGVPAVGPDDEPESQAVSPPFTGTKPRFGVTLQGYCSP